MDAADLARWTRFAAKGGIGKCMAIQDCIAESPEDLMFLKDDEITVLMQLNGQPGRYLGYCEGVVGRFQGEHVRFHAKLKRPVLTKRASSTAVSATSSPAPSVTPSPRMPLAQLANPNNGNAKPPDRDSAVLTDPFDLELDVPPKARRSEEADSQSDDNNGSRQRLTRGGDDLPGLEMFLPRSRSGSRSRRNSRGLGGDDKNVKLRTRILASQELQNASPQVNSLELPPSSPVKPPPSSSSESQLQRGSPESDKPEVEISVDEIVPRSVASPEPLGEESVPDKDVSSLYDGASMRSSFYSTHSYRSSVFGAGSGLNAGGLNALGRLSQAESDDGGLGMGIGLSMLQDMGDDDDDDSRTGEAVPPTPRPDKPREEDEQNMDVKDGMSGDLQDEREDDDDDGSYWDGADIYDNYRYSRYSVMTKNSRRKSRFSMISRNSVADPEPHDIPPIPLDAEGRLRSDSALSSPVSASQGEHERRKHVPPPLTLVKSTPRTSSMDPSLLSVGPTTLSPSTSRRSTSDFSAGGSPLLHTNFASPRTSSSRATSFGTDSVETPAQSPEPNSVPFTGAGASASVSGVASALRQRLENERSGSPTPLPSPLLDDGEQRNADEKPEGSEGHGGGIVVEDDESVSVTVVPADEGGPSKDDHINDPAKGSAPRDSVQSAISNASVASTTSFETDVSDVSGVMRKIEADLAVSAAAPSGSTLPLNLRSPSLDKDGQRTPNSTTFPAGPTQPLRLQERTPSRTAPAPSPLPSPDPGLQQIPSKQREGDLPNPHYAKSAPTPPSGSQLLRPEQALFLPHPNAPRPNPAVLSGQRTSTYGMPPVHEPQPQAAQSPQVGVNDGTNSLEAVLRAASASRIGPVGIPHRPTIFGKPVIDLASADGPVAMVWSLSPFAPEPVSRARSPAAGTRAPRRSTTAGASPLGQNVRLASTSPSPVPSNHASPIHTPASLPSPVKPSAQTPPPPQSSFSHNPSFPGASSNAIPRANFSPRVGAPRPRSRSFSGFGREVPTKPESNERAREEGSRPTRVASMQSLKEGARVAGNANPPNGHPLRQTSVAAAPSKTTHSPSPLSRPENNAVIGSPRTASLSKGLPSPLGRSFFSPSQLEPPDRAEAASDTETSNPRQLIPLVGRHMGVRQVASVDVLRTERKESPLVSPPRSILQPVRRNSGPAEGPASPANPTAPSAASSVMTSSCISSSSIQPLRRISSPSSKRHQRSTSQQSQNSNDSDPRSVVISSPPVNGNSSVASSLQRSNSGKSKISLSHLRIRSSTAKESLDVQTPSSTGPATPVFDFDSQPQTVQVQDAEFEMIRPTMRRVSSEPVSDDTVLGQDERPSFQQDSGGDSPLGGSVRSALSPTQSTVADSVRDRTTRLGKAPDDASTHNARELKWISTMSAVPAAQARKNKKIRRLVLEGVPSSVRYLVWGHLTDSKAKRIPGVYGQLGKRGRVAATEAIERDAARCFPDQPHLQDPKGPLVGLLQTYLTMVPDIEYQTSLCLVAGHLLLQSPEEDAFWTFTSMMDLHLRAYFSSRSVQMEADAMVFSKIVEVLNPFLAKKLFVDLAMHPFEICRMWFASLFATTLPQDYVNRIWDVYLCEGPPFLFRVALAILSCCRNAIEESRDRTAVFAFLSRPETLSLLPDDPEEFINMALSVKVKDDDIKKQRAKVESHLRQQTQSAQRSAAPRLVSSISLPRAPGAVATSL